MWREKAREREREKERKKESCRGETVKKGRECVCER